MAFQLVGEGEKKDNKTKKNSPWSDIFPLSEALSLCGLDLTERYLRTEWVWRLAMQVNILGGFVLFFTFSQVVR